MKKLIFFICALSACLLFTVSCTKPEEPDKPEKKLVFGYSTPSMQNSFWISVADAMKAAADAHNVELLIRDAASDNAKQAADIEDLIEQKVDAILFTPYDSVSLSPSIKNVNKAGIPVIIVDIGINDPDVDYDCLIITDNKKGGRLAGEWLVDYFKTNQIENPSVATIEAQLGAENARDRHRSFLQVMEENGIAVVAGQSADSMRDKAMVVMEDFLQAHPGLTAVFGECDDMALGALQAVKQAKADTIIIGYDGHIDACIEIAKGSNLMADVDQRPEEMGRLAVEIALKVIRGEKVNKTVLIEPLLIHKDNVQEFIDRKQSVND